MRLSSIKTLSILKYAASHSDLCSKFTNAYPRLAPVLKSRMTSHDVTFPNLLKIISKSSSVVTGLSLQTNKDSSGGLASASGKSPSTSSTTARLCASRLFFSSSTTAWSLFISASISKSSSNLSSSLFCGRGSDASGMSAANPSGSSNGSSSTIVCLILIFCQGRPFSSQYASFIACKTSKPSLTSPKIVLVPSRASTSSRVVMMNCDAFLFVPLGAMDTVPFL
mmetsp:Transcript_3809/g.12777  ORF Transcript_3809/g.12777 Transcript_3809/m.12777 type:complete len:224 (+) Transcript_3809:1504-2175(+)